jgi:spermidine synthase
LKLRQFIGYIDAWRRPRASVRILFPDFSPAVRFIGIALLAFLLAACAQGPRDVYVGKGLFGDIIVYDDAKGLRTLEFERNAGRHTIMKPGDPAHLEFEYARIALIALALARNPPERVLVVGLGGGTLPQFLRMAYPDARIDVAEIDPAVVRVAEDYFNLRQDERLRVHVGDGRAFVESAAPGSYDIIILDAYGVGTVPRHLTTVEFLRAARTALRPDGVAVSNIWGPNINALYRDMLSTHRAAFDALQIVYTPNDGNVLVLGLPRSLRLTQAELAARARAIAQPPLFRYDLGRYVEQAWLDADRVAVHGQILRDPAGADSAGMRSAP